MRTTAREEIVPSPRTVRPIQELRSLYTPQQVDHLVHRERMRADRTNSAFALVLFKADHDIGHTRTMLRLAKAMLGRVRGTDEVGWYEQDCLAAILPDTSASGAKRFAEACCSRANSNGVIPTFKIYSYPGEWFEDDLNNEIPGHRSIPVTQDRRAFPTVESAVAKIERKDLIPCIVDGVTDELSREVTVEPMHQLLVHPTPRSKRVIDIVGACFGLIMASPVMILCAVLIKLTSPGPVIFKQLRSGIGGRPFYIFKFRTMRPDAEKLKSELRQYSEQDGPAFKMKRDPRITSIGRLLRSTSLDELPQLINVLKGDMSLVGPRPLPIDESDECHQWQRRRLDVTPGLTCIWQVEGRSRVTFDEWMRMDTRYIKRRSFTRDIKLILKTIPAVILRRGAQ